MAIDPVCGMAVDEKTAQDRSEYAGQTYFFCSSICKSTFDQEHAKHAAQTAGEDGSGHSRAHHA